MPTRSMPHTDRRPTITPDEFADYVHALADELRAGARTMGMLDLAEALEAVCEEAARERALYRSPGNAAPDDAA